MLSYEIDDAEGLMFALRTRGPYEACLPTLAAAHQRLTRSARPDGMPRVLFSEAEELAEPPDERQRAWVWRLFDSDREPLVLTVVSPTSRSRAVADALQSSATEGTNRRQRGFDQLEPALEWVNDLRPGAKIALMRLRLRVHGKRLNLRHLPSLPGRTRSPFARIDKWRA